MTVIRNHCNINLFQRPTKRKVDRKQQRLGLNLNKQTVAKDNYFYTFLDSYLKCAETVTPSLLNCLGFSQVLDQSAADFVMLKVSIPLTTVYQCLIYIAIGNGQFMLASRAGMRNAEILKQLLSCLCEFFPSPQLII